MASSKGSRAVHFCPLRKLRRIFKMRLGNASDIQLNADPAFNVDDFYLKRVESSAEGFHDLRGPLPAQRKQVLELIDIIFLDDLSYLLEPQPHQSRQYFFMITHFRAT